MLRLQERHIEVMPQEERDARKAFLAKRGEERTQELRKMSWHIAKARRDLRTALTTDRLFWEQPKWRKTKTPVGPRAVLPAETEKPLHFSIEALKLETLAAFAALGQRGKALSILHDKKQYFSKVI